jgi:hypothetical protein
MSLKFAAKSFVLLPMSWETITRTLLLADDGVIDAVKPVSEKVDEDVSVSVEKVPCTTCNTVPALAVESNVPVFVGNVSV